MDVAQVLVSTVRPAQEMGLPHVGSIPVKPYRETPGLLSRP